MALSPPVVQFVAHGVIVCNCPAKSVMLLAIVGGTVTCPVCKRTFRVARTSYVVNGNEAQLDCTTEEVGQIITPDLSSLRGKFPGSLQ